MAYRRKHRQGMDWGQASRRALKHAETMKPLEGMVWTGSPEDKQVGSIGAGGEDTAAAEERDRRERVAAAAAKEEEEEESSGWGRVVVAAAEEESGGWGRVASAARLAEEEERDVAQVSAGNPWG